jgi:putative phosphoserine phosphatase/1-acylglycerol-3-phosphate O-acyltransferase
MKPFDLAIQRVLEGPRGASIGAFFDFDGTLIDGYSAAAYIVDRIQRRDMKPRELIDTFRLARRKDLTDTEFAEVIGRGLQEWAGRTEEQMRALWKRLWLKKIALTLFPEAWKLCQAHREMGHTVVIASSATPYQIEPLAEEFGIEHVLATQPKIRNGKLTGGLVGRPLWGTGKAEAVRKFAHARGLRLKQSFAYANGNEDIAFLQSVGRPTAVQPREQLERVATERDWPILRFPARRRAPRHAIARTVAAYGAMGATFLLGLGYSKASGDTRGAVDLITSVASDAALAVLGVKVEVQGEDHLWSHRPCVFIINHQSKFDMFLMMHLIRRNFTGVAKQEAAKVFGFGKFMKMADMAFIDRKHTGRAVDALKPAVERLKRGLCVVMAPEGTRSWTPRLGPFKKGAFHLAMQAGVPIVPVVIRNAGEIMGRNDQVMRAGKVQVAVLPAIDVSDWKASELDERIAVVHRLYVSTLKSWPGEKRP